jgi:phospholipid/cholesterol/gamma-HCH transport system permease protein
VTGTAAGVEATGRWNLQSLKPYLDELREELDRLSATGDLCWDLTGVEVMDLSGAAMFWRAWGRMRAPSLALRPEHEALFLRLRGEAPPLRPPRRLSLAGPVALVGMAVLKGLGHARDLILLLGFLALDTARLIVNPRRGPWREISANIYRSGAQALGITALVGFLIGVVLSYLSSTQLKLFGADLFIVNILGVSITRELGPVLAAILVAGRSGSSMTAQLGVMRVTQELDAMSVLGIPQVSRLILPKVIGLAVSLPLLVLWTGAIALIGGMVAANVELGISFLYFFDSLPAAVPIANLWLGIGKGVVFGMLIALLACHYGLRIRPNTESLGAGTTSSVVTAITIVILVDAVFAVLFRDVGLGF